MTAIVRPRMIAPDFRVFQLRLTTAICAVDADSYMHCLQVRQDGGLQLEHHDEGAALFAIAKILDHIDEVTVVGLSSSKHRTQLDFRYHGPPDGARRDVIRSVNRLVVGMAGNITTGV